MAAPAQVTIDINTSSSPIDSWQNLPAPQPPSITLNGTVLSAATNTPWTPNGCQVVVFQGWNDITDPASIISNKYVCVDDVQQSWGQEYQWMWDAVATQIMSSGNVQQQIVIIATFGLDVLMTPTAATFELCLGRGAGAQLQTWGLLPSVSEGSMYIEYPANYVLIGNSGYGYGEGYESFEYATEDGDTIKTELTVTIGNPGA
jgi:hypothetical protein